MPKKTESTIDGPAILKQAKAVGVKKHQVWHFKTIERRCIDTALTEMAAQGQTIFGVYNSMISGHFEVLSYEMKVADGTGTL